MYALRDYLGEDLVNSALRKLVDYYAYRTTPYPTSRSLIAGPQYDALIADLFERITLYDFRVRTASARNCRTVVFGRASKSQPPSTTPMLLDKRLLLGWTSPSMSDCFFAAAR